MSRILGELHLWVAAITNMTPQEVSDAIIGLILILSSSVFITTHLVMYLLGYNRGLEANRGHR